MTEESLGALKVPAAALCAILTQNRQIHGVFSSVSYPLLSASWGPCDQATESRKKLYGSSELKKKKAFSLKHTNRSTLRNSNTDALKICKLKHISKTQVLVCE